MSLESNVLSPRVLSTLAGVVLLVSGCSDQPGAPASRASGDSGAATVSLDTLKIAKHRPMTGYSRDRFPHWRKAGPNCDVRDTVLQRDGKNVKTDGCNVTGGEWFSVYDGLTLTEPLKVDVDHMIPLANAWRSGADSWTNEKRGEFANDLDRPQLFAVSASSNRSKGDQDPSQWKPPRQEHWCTYAQQWIAVKVHWQLTVTTAEKGALTAMLGTCV